MTETDKAPQPATPARADDQAHPSSHRNPFGEHPQGIGPTLGEDLADEAPPTATPTR